MKRNYACACGGNIDGIPLCYATDMPVYAEHMDLGERSERVILTNDTCVIDGEYFFIKGSICLPVHDIQKTFEWGVWLNVTKEDYLFMENNWLTRGRERIIPDAYGYLATQIPIYPETTNHIAMARTMHLGCPPLFGLQATDHPLSIEQKQGITLARVREIAELMAQYQ